MKILNLFDISCSCTEKENIDLLVKFKNTRVERIVSTGQTTDWLDQDEDEFVALIKGYARIAFKESETEIELKAGDTLFIPMHMIHRVSYTSTDEECIWLCFFAK